MRCPKGVTIALAVPVLAALLVLGAPVTLAKKGGPPQAGAPAIACVKNQLATSGKLVNKSMLVVMDGDGSHETVLLEEVFEDVSRGARFFDPSWSPDATRIAFFVDAYDAQHDGGLHTVAADGTDLVRIGPGRDPAWSPDGSEIAYVHGDDIWIVELEGGSTENVTDSAGVAESAPTWSCDGTRLAYIADGTLVVHNLSSNGTAEVAVEGYLVGYPAWAKTGNRIAFVAWQESGGGSGYGPPDIWIVDLDAGGPENLTNTSDVPEIQPSWSADATQIVFRTFPAGDVYVIGEDGTGLTLIAAREEGRRSVSMYEAPDWRR